MIRKYSKNMGWLIIKAISKDLAREMIIKNHYSHKWNNGGFGRYNYGIFKEDEPDVCLGVAVYGLMKCPNAKIFSSNNHRGWMCELNRMWIDDCLGKNAETILIGASLKLLKKDDPDIVAVQSFADGRLGCGTIYKAANFRYFGFHYTIFARVRRNGEVIHQQIFTNSTSPTGYLRTNVAFLLGECDYFKVKTYRYIYPLDASFRFFGKQLPYPVYENGEFPFVWIRNKALIKERIKRILDIIVP
ncbi:MAG: hypothetical protein PHD21_07380 [Flavobacteriales bacterium]|nr:hypothetical protein [Flavobacteriales bacterium]